MAACGSWPRIRASSRICVFLCSLMLRMPIAARHRHPSLRYSDRGSCGFGEASVPDRPAAAADFPLRRQQRVSIAGLPRRSFSCISELAFIVNIAMMVSATSTFETDESTPDIPSPASPLIVRFGPRDRRKTPPVRRPREAAGKYLIYTALSRMAGGKSQRRNDDSPCLPAFTGVGEIARRLLLAGLEVAKTGWRAGGAHGGVVFSDPRGFAARRNIDLNRDSVAAWPAQYVSAGRLANPAVYAANGRPGVHDALHSGARRQDHDEPRAGSAAGDGGVPAWPRARRRCTRRPAGGLGGRYLLRPPEGARLRRDRH